ncbi:hypothetical protein NLI96_g8984 [Meripilus lineatus]|uniref:Uncharacterized protein n=1 Tax=Meripilus lineatus TaxID=2056292 RepID=A0AAD5UWD7_9APHY|nr:hypothetical protein NLI96_g8984 [Physisporinus lineatus]
MFTLADTTYLWRDGWCSADISSGLTRIPSSIIVWQTSLFNLPVAGWVYVHQVVPFPPKRDDVVVPNLWFTSTYLWGTLPAKHSTRSLKQVLIESILDVPDVIQLSWDASNIFVVAAISRSDRTRSRFSLVYWHTPPSVG